MRFVIRNPFDFFQKIGPVKESFMILLISAGVFAVFNELSIFYGFTKYSTKIGPVESIIGNFFLIVVGFLIVTVVLYLVSITIKKVVGLKSLIFIISYSFMPLLIGGWIPIGFITAIVGMLSFFYMLIGVHIILQTSYKKAFFITLIEFCLLAFLIIAVNLKF